MKPTVTLLLEDFDQLKRENREYLDRVLKAEAENAHLAAELLRLKNPILQDRPAPVECDEPARCGECGGIIALGHYSPCRAGDPAHRAPEAAKGQECDDPKCAIAAVHPAHIAYCQTHKDQPRPCATCTASEADTGPDPDYGLDPAPAPGAVTLAEVVEALREMFERGEGCAACGDGSKGGCGCRYERARALLARLEKEAPRG